MTIRYSRQHGAYEITSLPGQSQVAVSHSFFVRDDQRQQGNGHRLKDLQKGDLRLANYDYAICTVAAGNAAQKKILTLAGWQKLDEFRNTRSNEKTEIWSYHVNGPDAGQKEMK